MTEPFVATSIARRLITRMQATHDRRRISVFSGPPGIGKTTAIDEFLRRRPGEVAVVKVARRNAREVLVLQHTLEAMRRLTGSFFEHAPSSVWELRNDLFGAICQWAGAEPSPARRGEYDPEAFPRLTIVFDEAQNLSREAIDGLRYWNDADRCYAPFPLGLVFVGNNEFSLSGATASESVISAAVADRALYLQTFEYDDVTLQGPPGTGKTRLLTTCVLTLLEADQSRQLLVTAHSHEAIKNVRRTLMKRIDRGLDFDPLVVRLDDDADEQHVARVTGGLRDALRCSELAERLPPALRKKIEDEANLEPGAPPLRSFELLVRDAANVVLATSNSGELARMLEDQRRFDWSIIEEAGKAHGFDLALALQSSPKILLIGDQDQLPPFNFEALQALFREPQRILEAVKLGARYAPSLVDRTFSRLTAEERAQFDENVPAWLEMVLFFSDLYRRCYASERSEIRLAARLTEQHRMHPVIAHMVSECFYGHELVTHEEAEDRFAKEPSPVSVRPGSWLPDKPFVFIDMPWVQEDKDATGEEGGPGQGPRYSNPLEAEVIVKALAELRPVTTPCEIQLLSPYRAQVNLISDRIQEALASDRLTRLQHLDPPLAGKALGATVDEFQGSEADAVLVSLVRNNDEKIGRGVGFLADRRRFNVLLSRARHRLIVVGSWRFLESRIDCSKAPDDDLELAHIARFVRWMKAAEAAGDIARVKYTDLLEATSA